MQVRATFQRESTMRRIARTPPTTCPGPTESGRGGTTTSGRPMGWPSPSKMSQSTAGPFTVNGGHPGPTPGRLLALGLVGGSARDEAWPASPSAQPRASSLMRRPVKRRLSIERYRARYRDEAGKEHARHFVKKAQAQRWLDEVTASVVRATMSTRRPGRPPSGSGSGVGRRSRIGSTGPPRLRP